MHNAIIEYTVYELNSLKFRQEEQKEFLFKNRHEIIDYYPSFENNQSV